MKNTTQDEYLQRIYKVIYYIEVNYQDTLDMRQLAKVAGFSMHHFHRVFKVIMGENIGDYIRRVRLQSSTTGLKNAQSITEVAMQSGYETHASFAKAFKSRFGLSPKAFSQNYKNRTGVIMKGIKVVEREPVEVLYVRRTGDYMQSAGEAWGVLMGFAYEQKIKHKKNLMGKEAVMYGIGHDDPNITPQGELRYDACLSYDDKSVEPSGEIGVKHIDGGRYVNYLHKGAYEGLKEVYANMMAWIMENEYALGNRPCFEIYHNRDPRRTKPENLRTEVFIAVE